MRLYVKSVFYCLLFLHFHRLAVVLSTPQRKRVEISASLQCAPSNQVVHEKCREHVLMWIRSRNLVASCRFSGITQVKSCGVGALMTKYLGLNSLDHC